VISAVYFLGVVAFLLWGRFAAVFATAYAMEVSFFTYGVVYSGFARPRYYDHLALVRIPLLFPESFTWSYALHDEETFFTLAILLSARSSTYLFKSTLTPPFSL
jgi:hypothetical protein